MTHFFKHSSSAVITPAEVEKSSIEISNEEYLYCSEENDDYRKLFLYIIIILGRAVVMEKYDILASDGTL